MGTKLVLNKTNNSVAYKNDSDRIMKQWLNKKPNKLTVSTKTFD